MNEPTWPGPPTSKTCTAHPLALGRRAYAPAWPASHRPRDRAIGTERSRQRVPAEDLGHGELRRVEPYTQPGRLGYLEVAAASFERAGEGGREGPLIPFGILLDDEVGDGDVQVDRGRGEDGPQEVVGHHGGMERFGEGRDLLAVRQATSKPDVGAHVLAAAMDEQLAELPDRVQALAVGQGARDAARDLGLRLDAIDLDGVLDEQRVKRGQRRSDGKACRGVSLRCISTITSASLPTASRAAATRAMVAAIRSSSVISA